MSPNHFHFANLAIFSRIYPRLKPCKTYLSYLLVEFNSLTIQVYEVLSFISMIKTRWLKLFSTRKKKTIFKSKLSPSFLGTALIAVEFPGEPKLCNRIDTWKTVNRILVGGTMVRNRKSARPGVTRIRRRKLFDVRTVYGSGVHNPSLDTIYRGDSVDKWPLVGHVHPQNRNARVPLIDRKPIFARQLSPNTKFSAEENRGGPSIDDSTPALERLNRGCNYSLPPVMPYFDFA